MKNLVTTLTTNPSLDKSTHFSGLLPEQKIRCETPHYDAGGGGINVSKAIARLGGTSTAIYTSGGPIGKTLNHLIEKEGFDTKVIETANWTRENFIAFNNADQSQYRFGFPGPELSEAEQREIEKAVAASESTFLVLSGSLNEGLSPAFYAQIAKKAKESGTKVIVDTSGDALQNTLDAGVYLAKPNLGELAKLTGVEKIEDHEIETAAKKLIANGAAEIIVISLGAKGAVLVTKDQTEWVKAPEVTKKSTVGAGDSMVGAMVWALSQNKSLKEVLQWGVACGSAATMNEGTKLFTIEDAQLLFDKIEGSE